MARRLQALISALLLATSVGVVANANASLQQLSNLFVFGDSLEDGGNSGLRTQQFTGNPNVVFPPSPYFNGRFSNGPVAAEYLWNMFNPGNTSFKPSLAGGTNYAIGGSTSGLQNFNEVNGSVPNFLKPAYAQYGAQWQLDTFAAQAPVFNPATSLFIVWFFPNDVFYADTTGTLPGTVNGSPGGANVISNGIANILTTIQTLAAAGAEHFLIPNMADLGATPEFRGTAQAPVLSGLTSLFNANLAAALSALDDVLPAELVLFDTAATFADILANPGSFGFSNVTERCIDNLLNGLCDPNTWLFWDGVHPTTAGHLALASQFATAIPEPSAIALVALAVLLLIAARRARRS